MRTINGFAPPAFQMVLGDVGTHKEQTDTHRSGLAGSGNADHRAGRRPLDREARCDIRSTGRRSQPACGFGVRPADIGRSYKNRREYLAHDVQGGICKNSRDRSFAGLGVDVVSTGDTPGVIFVVRRFGDHLPDGDTG